MIRPRDVRRVPLRQRVLAAVSIVVLCIGLASVVPSATVAVAVDLQPIDEVVVVDGAFHQGESYRFEVDVGATGTRTADKATAKIVFSYAY